MKSMDVTTLTVKYMGKDAKGKVRLSRKAVLEDQYGGNNNNKSVPPSSIPVNGAATMATGVVESASSTDMSQDEMDVISKVIDGQL
jgi:hypothetical protein